MRKALDLAVLEARIRLLERQAALEREKQRSGRSRSAIDRISHWLRKNALVLGMLGAAVSSIFTAGWTVVTYFDQRTRTQVVEPLDRRNKATPDVEPPVPRDGDPPDLDGPRIRLLINEQPQMLTMPAQRALISAASLMREGFEEEAVNKIAYDYLTIAGFFERSKVDARPVAKWRDWQTLAIFTNVPDTNPVSLHWIEKPDVPATFTPADPDGLPVVPVVEASQPDLSPDGKA